MSLEERMRTVARQEIAKAPGQTASEADELRQQIADLHTELHAVATRVAALEKQPEPHPGAEPAPRAAGRARKATGE